MAAFLEQTKVNKLQCFIHVHLFDVRAPCVIVGFFEGKDLYFKYYYNLR